MQRRWLAGVMSVVLGVAVLFALPSLGSALNVKWQADPQPVATPGSQDAFPLPPDTESRKLTMVTTPPALRFGLWFEGGAKEVALAKSAGAGWSRLIFHWATIEKQPGVYNFAPYDDKVRSRTEAGIRLIVEVRDNPAWAASTFCGPIDKPEGLEAFERFITALVQRYSPAPYGVKHWEFYNEPDGTDMGLAAEIGMSCWGDKPKEYVQMLTAASTAAKAVDPEAKIVIGGLAHQNPPMHFRLDFLDRLLAEGGADYFDIANLHHFSSNARAWVAYGIDIEGKVNAARYTMSKHGVDKPIMVTETSWTSSGAGEHQARYVTKVLARGLAADLYAIIWFTLVDFGDRDDGLVESDLEVKRSYIAYQVAVTAIGQATAWRKLDPRELEVTGGIEGYAFTVEGKERWILWALPTAGELWVKLPPASQACDRLGNLLDIQPGAPTPMLVGDSPMYVWLEE